MKNLTNNQKEEKEGKTIIVTGATGQDGSYMIEYLLENTEDTIIAAVRRTSQAILSNLEVVLNNPRVKIVTADLNDCHSIENIIKDYRPDYFINFGAQTYVADSWKSPALHMQTNAISLINIIESVRRYAPNCRVYSAGSSEQFGDVSYSPQDEKHPFSPRSVYGVSKCAASQICKVYRESYGLYIVHGVLFNHEGPRRQEYFVTRKITKGVARIRAAIAKGEPFEPIRLGNLNSLRDWSYAKDFIEGVWMMLNQDVFNEQLKKELEEIDFSSEEEKTQKLSEVIKDYVMASGETHSIREFVELSFLYAGLSGEWTGFGLDEKYLLKESHNNLALVEVSPEFFRPAEVDLLWGDSSLIKNELGWKPKTKFSELVKLMTKSDLEKEKKIKKVYKASSK
jgi:GDPmannose 4,6-dehydratase